MSIKILKDEDKMVQIFATCKKKNFDYLQKIINSVVENYEGVPVLRHNKIESLIFHNEILIDQKRNKNYNSLLDCMYTEDFKKHF